MSIKTKLTVKNVPVQCNLHFDRLAIKLWISPLNLSYFAHYSLAMSLCRIPTHAFLLILRYIGRPLDFMRMLTVSKDWKERFNESDTELWHTISVEYDIVFNAPNLKRSLRSTTDHRKVFFRAYFKKQREMDDRHELLIVQAKAILEGVRDQPSKLIKLIEKLLPNQRYFNPDARGKTMEDNTLLTLCCRYFQNKCIRLMVERFNADVNVPDVGGFTPLILCAYHGNFAGVLYLLKRNVDLLAVGRLRSGPRLIAEHWAALQGHAAIFRYLHALRRRSFLQLKKQSNAAVSSSMQVTNIIDDLSESTVSAGSILVDAPPLMGMEPAAMLLTEAVEPILHPIFSSNAYHSELQLPPLMSTTLGLLFSDTELEETGDSNWSALTTTTHTAPSSLFSNSVIYNPWPGSHSHVVASSSSGNSSHDQQPASSSSSTHASISMPTASEASLVPIGLDAAHVSTTSTTETTVEEALFCLCKRGYEGQMIGCDSTNCPVEWYHYECVGLHARPAGQWLCGLCTATTDKTHLRCSLTAPTTTITDSSESDDPFCICGHEGVGQMVSCDNARCLVQWFHFTCVGITAEPDGAWECPLCRGGTFAQPPLPLETTICPVIPVNVSHKAGKRGRRVGKGRMLTVLACSADVSDVSSGAPSPKASRRKSGTQNIVSPCAEKISRSRTSKHSSMVNGAGVADTYGNCINISHASGESPVLIKRRRQSV